VLVAIGLAATRLARSLVHVAWRLGFDRERRLGWWVVASKLVILAAIAILIGRGVVSSAPLLGAALLVGAAAASLTVLRAQLENLAVGVGLVLRHRLKEGDRVTLGDVSGVVRELGLSRLHLRRPDGSAVLIPNRLLNTNLVVVEQSRHTARVAVTLELDAPPTREVLERLRRTAVLSPFRAMGTALTVVRDRDQPHRVVVEVQTHSSALIDVATRQLEAVLAESVQESPALGEKVERPVQ
jgi:small-conductance mechanosensitive channel